MNSPWKIVEKKEVTHRPPDPNDPYERPIPIGFPIVKFVLHHEKMPEGKNITITYSHKLRRLFKVVNSLEHVKEFTMRTFIPAARQKYGDDIVKEILIAIG